jgi:hypothetical protein
MMAGLDRPSVKLRRLHETAERISASLVELEVDPTRTLLESSTLSGESAARWSAASAALSELWRRRELLEDLLGRADELQRAKRSDELDTLLRTDSVQMSGSEVPLAERSLFGTDKTSRRCSPDQLLQSMSAAFDDVKTIVADIDAAWGRLTPTLDGARALLRESRELAEELGEPDRRDLEEAAQTVASLSSLIATDPLSAAAAKVDRLADELRAIHRDLADGAALKHGFADRIRSARELAERLRSAIGDAHSARGELMVKIALSAPPPEPKRYDALIAELTEITETGRLGAWRPARDALDDWTARTQDALERTHQTVASLRAPIHARNQFRALLDAYQAKAKGLGLVEDPELAEGFVRAQAALYTAPTDLAIAARLVRGYQQAVSGLPAAEEGPS